jgi:hypothetical protein
LLDACQETPLREALEIFTDLGAAAAARITRQRMRALGVRSIPVGPQTATRAHPLGLTRREREVLGLICRVRQRRDRSPAVHPRRDHPPPAAAGV